MTTGSSQDEVYLLNEGGVLNVCYNRTELFSDSDIEDEDPEIKVSLIGTSGNWL